MRLVLFSRKSDVVGVSVRTILTNVVVQTIILLYLWDKWVFRLEANVLKQS